MKNYLVKIKKTITHTLYSELEINADDDQQAREMALDAAENGAVTWSEPIIDKVQSSRPSIELLEPVVDFDDPE